MANGEFHMAIPPTIPPLQAQHASTTVSLSAEQLACQLVSWFLSDRSYAIALSGGVDSAVVAQAAALASVPAIAITARSPSVAQRELNDAQLVIAQTGLEHVIIDTREVQDHNYQRNDARRCYFCKSQLFSAIQQRFPLHTIVTGTNLDDLSDYRPGLQAASESSVRSPLAELSITKQQVRVLAEHWQLPLADKPASPCLASRIAHGVPVTAERLAMVENAEEFLRKQGLIEFRVRLHAEDLARIEVSQDALLQLASPETRQQLTQELHALGFRYITLDLDGFRSGSLNPLFQIQSPRDL
ncbi:MAG: ATP-dependent sacrificial sulfur transferase LarE [Pirellulaceae bacterium]